MTDRRRVPTVTVIGIAIAGLAALGALTTQRRAPRAAAQDAAGPAETAEALMQEIRFLDLLRRLDVTGEQRAKAAQAIEAFGGKRTAIQGLASPPELVSALKTVRETLLAGGEPTDEMREAVEAAQPPDDGSIDQALMEARTAVLDELTAIFTDEQKTQLRTMPLIEVAQEILWMCIESRERDAAEAQEMRTGAFPQLREGLAAAAGDNAQNVLADFQGLINRISAMTPEQVEQQDDKLVEQVVTLLSGTLDAQPEMADERLKDQLWEWVMEPRVGELLRESAEVMGAM